MQWNKLVLHKAITRNLFQGGCVFLLPFLHFLPLSFMRFVSHFLFSRREAATYNAATGLASTRRPPQGYSRRSPGPQMRFGLPVFKARERLWWLQMLLYFLFICIIFARYRQSRNKQKTKINTQQERATQYQQRHYAYL